MRHVLLYLGSAHVERLTVVAAGAFLLIDLMIRCEIFRVHHLGLHLAVG
jgi:hypothetical protein